MHTLHHYYLQKIEHTNSMQRIVCKYEHDFNAQNPTPHSCCILQKFPTTLCIFKKDQFLNKYFIEIITVN